MGAISRQIHRSSPIPKLIASEAYNEPTDNGGRPLTGWRIQRAAGQSLSFRGVGPLCLSQKWKESFSEATKIKKI